MPPFIAYALRSGSSGRPNNQVLIHVQFQQELSLDLDHFVEFAESVAMLRVRHTQPQLPQVTTTVAVACARTAAASCRVQKETSPRALQALLPLLQGLASDGIEGWSSHLRKLGLPSACASAVCAAAACASAGCAAAA